MQKFALTGWRQLTHNDRKIKKNKIETYENLLFLTLKWTFVNSTIQNKMHMGVGFMWCDILLSQLYYESIYFLQIREKNQSKFWSVLDLKKIKIPSSWNLESGLIF